MKEVFITSEYITLGQFLKYTGIIGSGALAKEFLLNSKVIVNGELETRRGRKLYEGFEVIVENEKYIIRK